MGSRIDWTVREKGRWWEYETERYRIVVCWNVLARLCRWKIFGKQGLDTNRELKTGLSESPGNAQKNALAAMRKLESK